MTMIRRKKEPKAKTFVPSEQNSLLIKGARSLYHNLLGS